MKPKNTSTCVFLFIFLVTGFLAAPLYAEEEVNNGQDLTRPLTRLDIRQKYQTFEGDYFASFTTLRADKPFILENGWMFSTRLDIPFAYTDIPTIEDPGGDSRFGITDILVQGVLVAPQGQKSWTWVSGMQIVAPTASDDAMGTGRFHLAPLVAFKLDAPCLGTGSFAAILISNHFDVGGNDDRGEVNYLAVQPIININLPAFWVVTVAPEMRVNWELDDSVFFPFDILVGKMISRSTILSLQYKTPLIEDYQMYEHEIELRAGFFF